ncbi:MAG: major capsid protein [Cellvibrio sp.]
MKNTFSVLRSKGAKFAAAASAMSLTAAAKADSVLPATFTADMGDVRTDILAIGGALIGLAVVAVGIKWVKATFFG